MSDASGDERPAADAKKPRQKRFKFKKFEERINEIDVDIHRAVKRVRSDPLPGHESFLSEHLQKWRDTNTAEHFNELYKTLRPLCQSMPLVVHNAQAIFDLLVRDCHLGARLSLPATLGLLGVLPRDLQGDFRPLFPALVDALADLIEAGGDRDPEVLELAFTCLAHVCKHHHRFLQSDLPLALRQTARLRYSKVDHVRSFAAEALGYLVRTAPHGAVAAAVRAVLVEHAAMPTTDRTDGAGALLAEAVCGAANGLHSRAPALLALLLAADPISVKHFKSADAVPEVGVLRARVTAVCCAALYRILEHLRRGRCAELWDAVVTAARERLATAEAVAGKGGAGGDAEARDAVPHAARAIGLLSQMVEHRGGSRVEDYSVLLGVCSSVALSKAFTARHAAEDGGDGAEYDIDDYRKHLAPTLTGQALRLAAAVVRGHAKVVGASRGVAALAPLVSAWAPLFTRPPTRETLPFVRALVGGPAGAEVARLMSGPMLGAVGRSLLAEDAETDELALPLLQDVCATAQPRPAGAPGGPKAGLPLILTAQPGGPQLAAKVRETAARPLSTDDCASARPAKRAKRASARGAEPKDPRGVLDAAAIRASWCAARCLPYTTNDPEDALRHQDAAMEAMRAALAAADTKDAAWRSLHVASAEALRSCAAAHAALGHAPRVQELADRALATVRAHPRSFHALRAAADARSHLPQAAQRAPLDLALLEELTPNLSDASQPLRRETLRVLCSFRQPAAAANDTNKNEEPSAVLNTLLSVEAWRSTLENGRKAAMVLGRVKADIEFGRIPPELRAAVSHSLIGLLHIRFSLIWQPALDALATANEHIPHAAWPPTIAHVTAAQTAFLSGNNAGHDAGTAVPGLEDQDAQEEPERLAERFAALEAAGDAASGGGCTDASTRLGLLLKALQKVPSGELERVHKEWLPLALEYIQAKARDDTGLEEEAGDAGEEGGEEDSGNDGSGAAGAEGGGEAVVGGAGVSGKEWRVQMRAWLDMMACVKGIRGLYRAKELLGMVATLVGDADPALQAAAIRALRAFRIKFLTPYADRLLRLADNKTLRGELAVFMVAPDAPEGEGILKQHRAGVVPVLSRLLFARMRKRSGRLGGRGAPGSARSAILNFLGALDPSELAPLIELFLKPVSAMFARPAPACSAHKDQDTPPWPRDALLVEPTWWFDHLGREDAHWWLAAVSAPRAAKLPHRRRVGLINALDDIVAHLGFAAAPYLPTVAAIAVRLLQISTDPPPDVDALPTAEAKELRVKSLRLITRLFERFADEGDFGPLWPCIFAACGKLAERLAAEVSAPRPPALLSLCTALLSAPALAGVLAEPPGSAILGAALATLGAPAASPASLGEALATVEAALALEDDAKEKVLRTHVPELLGNLRSSVERAWGGSAGRGGARMTRSGHRELAILESLADMATAPHDARSLVRALIALLARRDGRGRALAATDQAASARALRTVSAVLRSPAAGAAFDDEAALWGHVDVIGPLVGSMVSDDARRAVCAALAALARHLPGVRGAAEALEGLNAAAEGGLGDPDYDKRMGAFSALTGAGWTALGAKQAPIVVHQLLYDLRNPDDLALRQAASQALSRLLDASLAAEAPTGPDGTPAPDGLAGVVFRLLLPQLKTRAASSNLGVRQEHLALLRQSILRAPWTSPDLVSLVSADPDADFLVNVAHLQLNRRVKALARLRAMLAAGDDGGKQLPGVGSLLGFLVPLIQQMIVEGRAKEEGPKMKDKDVDREANVVDAAATALGAVAGRLPWPQYDQLLNRFIRLMRGGRAGRVNPATQKKLINAVCSILDNFHFLAGVRDGSARPLLPRGAAPAQRVGAAGPRAIGGLGDDEEATGTTATNTAGATGAAATGADAPAQPAAERDSAGEKVADGAGGAEAGAAGELEAAVVVDDDGEDGEDPEDVRGVFDGGAEASSEDILRSLVGRALPSLRGTLVERDGEHVRAGVALALVKVIRLLPRDIEQLELPKVLQTVANVLKSRFQRVRDDARRVLVAVSRELGPYYMPFLAQVLQAALPLRGFAANVLGFTIHAVLEGAAGKGAPGAEAGCLDEATEQILPMLDADLFGAASETAEVAAIRATYREARTCRSPQAFELLARWSTFDKYGRFLLQLVAARLPYASTSAALRTKLRGLLAHAARGTLANPTATAQDLMMFVHSTVGRALDAEEAAARHAAGDAGLAGAGTDALARGKKRGDRRAAAGLTYHPTIGPNSAEARRDTNKQVQEALHEGAEALAQQREGAVGVDVDAVAASNNGHMLMDFALGLLHTGLKKGPLDKRDDATLGLLDPMLPLLARAVVSRHTSCASLALRCLAFLVHLPLPGLETTAPDVGAGLLKLMKRCAKPSHPVAQDCLRLMGGLLRDCPTYKPPAGHIRFVLSWAFTDLEDSETRVGLFSLLRAVIARNVVVPEVYDVVGRVQELMVKSQHAPVRAMCATVLLQFLLDFPVGEKRIEQHILFLLSNLDYTHETGREAVLDTLDAVVRKFPPEALSRHGHAIFLVLVSTMVNDSSPKCRAAAAAVARGLIERSSQADADAMAASALAWAGGDKPGLRRASAQVVGLFAEVEGGKFARRAQEALSRMLLILARRVEAEDATENEAGDADADEGNVAGAGAWQEAYYALLAVEKVLVKVPDVASAFPDECTVLWEATSGLLSDPHLWVRKSASRLIGHALGSETARAQLLTPEPDAPAWRTAHSLALSLLSHLQAPQCDDALAAQAVKCLVSLLPEMRDEIEAAGSESESDAEDPTPASRPPGVTLHGLVRRIVKLAEDGRRAREVQRSAALKFLAAAATRLGPERIAPYLSTVMRPLYRAVEGPQAAATSEAVRELAQQVLAHLRGVVGGDASLAAWSAARDEVQARRARRKEAEAREVLVDPGAAVARKVAKHGRKRRAEKEKMEELKRRKGAGVPLGELAPLAKKRRRQARGGEV
ncbi:unnamed protein product [Pedinophyceae sp. YPF-701]|nr:unnamed protein product [Pedinophyceae sp. YPF-701]